MLKTWRGFPVTADRAEATRRIAPPPLPKEPSISIILSSGFQEIKAQPYGFFEQQLCCKIAVREWGRNYWRVRIKSFGFMRHAEEWRQAAEFYKSKNHSVFWQEKRHASREYKICFQRAPG
jgi:hypothetical protein